MLRTTQGSITALIKPNGVIGVNNNYVGVHILTSFIFVTSATLNENSMKNVPDGQARIPGTEWFYGDW